MTDLKGSGSFKSPWGKHSKGKEEKHGLFEDAKWLHACACSDLKVAFLGCARDNLNHALKVLMEIEQITDDDDPIREGVNSLRAEIKEKIRWC